MRRHIAWIVAALVVLAAVGAGIGAWALTRPHSSPLPQISAYSHGRAVRVDPYLYCNVVNLDDCVKPGAQGELAVSARYPVQLSVPARIGQAPWRLLRVYEDDNNTTTSAFRPGARLAVTVPTRSAAGWSASWSNCSPWSKTRTENCTTFLMRSGRSS